MSKEVNLEEIVEIVEKAREGVLIGDIQEESKLSYKDYKILMAKALHLGIIKDYEEYNRLTIKLSPEVKRLIAKYRKDGWYMGDIMNKLKMSEATCRLGLRKAVEEGYITKEEHKRLTKEFICLGYERKKMIHGKKKARQMCSDSWSKGIGNNHERLVEAARNGGNKTQGSAPHVIENIAGPGNYGQNPKYMYKGVTYDSKEEMRCGIFLLKAGLVKKIVEGENFQVWYEGKRIDFVIPDKITGKPIAIEDHPSPKGMEEHEEYCERRVKGLREAGFEGDIIIIRKLYELYKAGLVPSFDRYVKIKRAVDREVDKAIKLEKLLGDVPDSIKYFNL